MGRIYAHITRMPRQGAEPPMGTRTGDPPILADRGKGTVPVPRLVGGGDGGDGPRPPGKSGAASDGRGPAGGRAEQPEPFELSR